MEEGWKERRGEGERVLGGRTDRESNGFKRGNLIFLGRQTRQGQMVLFREPFFCGSQRLVSLGSTGGNETGLTFPVVPHQRLFLHGSHGSGTASTADFRTVIKSGINSAWFSGTR